MEVANRLSGIGEYYFSQKLQEIEVLNSEGKKVINLGIGSPDLPPHPVVIRVLQEESANENVHAYQSYKGALVLRNAFSNWYKKWYNVDLNPETEILPLIGSKEGLMHVCMTYLNKGDEVLIPNPGYPTYKSAVHLAGGKCKEYRLVEKNNYAPDFEKLNKSNLKKVKLMFVNYPHMPTGQLASDSLFEKLIAFAKKNKILIIHDNPYSFILNDNPKSLLQTEGAMDCAIELNSLSKSHNMAGWRVGILCGAKERIEEILRFKSNMDSGMFLPVQVAAAAALQLGKEWHEGLNNTYANRREKVFELLDLLKCKYSKQQVGLFVWAKIPSTFRDGFEFSDFVLNQANVFITPGSIFGTAGKKYSRVSLCCSEEKIGESIFRIINIKK